MAIWQDLVTDYGFTGGYQSVKRFVRKLRGSTQPEAVGIIVTAPGEEAQVDYGTGPMVRDPQSGQVPPHAAVRADTGLQPQIGSPADLPIQHTHLGRTARESLPPPGRQLRVVVLDNLQEGVLTPDIYDPTLNPLFKDVLAHYGVVGHAVPRSRSGSQRERWNPASATRRRHR